MACYNDMEWEGRKLTPCDDPLPIFKGSPFSLSCEAEGRFDPSDVQWFLGDLPIQPGKEFFHHVRYAEMNDSLGNIYLINGRIHVTRAAKDQLGPLSCQIFGKRSDDFNAKVIEATPDAVKPVFSCFPPNLNDVQSEITDDNGVEVLSVYENSVQGSRNGRKHTNHLEIMFICYSPRSLTLPLKCKN